jgi:uncharacterized membrane protein YqjE
MNDLETPPVAPVRSEPTVTELVSGIVNDTQTLIKQQIDLVKAELKHDIKRTGDAAKYFGVGFGLSLIAALFLLVSLPLFVHWLFPQLPEFACWAITGGVLLVAGLVAFYLGKRVFDSFNPLPDKSMHAMQENLSWIANPRK